MEDTNDDDQGCTYINKLITHCTHCIEYKEGNKQCYDKNEQKFKCSSIYEKSLNSKNSKISIKIGDIFSLHY